MKIMKNIFIKIFGLFFGFVLALQPELSAGAEMRTPSEFKSISSNTLQLIPKLKAELPGSMQQLAIWPTTEIIQKKFAKEDISPKLPPIYREGSRRDAPPLRPGGMSPQAAIGEAEYWVKQVLKSEWIPTDLRERLIPLREDAAERSQVIVRYEVDGNAFQLSQTRWGISVIVKPAGEGKVNEPEKIASTVFERYFNKGKEMSLLPGTRISSPEEWIMAFQLDEAKLTGPEALENWWGWSSWYTDGHALAVFLRKRTSGEQHTSGPDEPWF